MSEIKSSSTQPSNKDTAKPHNNVAEQILQDMYAQGLIDPDAVGYEVITADSVDVFFIQENPEENI